MNAKEFTQLVDSHSSVRGFIPIELQQGLPVLGREDDRWLLEYMYYPSGASVRGIELGKPAYLVKFGFLSHSPVTLTALGHSEPGGGLYSEVFTDPAGCLERERAYFAALDNALASLEAGREPEAQALSELKALLLSAVPKALRHDYEQLVS